VTEVEVDEALVRSLLSSQFPHWADLPLTPVRFKSTDNAVLRLGDRLSVRVPRVDGAVPQVERELAWLPEIGPRLPLPVPTIAGAGVPTSDHPWPWSIHHWLPGETPDGFHLPSPRDAAGAMGRFIAALQRIDLVGGRLAGAHTGHRGAPLAMRDAPTRAAIEARRSWFDVEPLLEAWDASLRAPVWDGPPVWMHGDLHPGNVLVDGDRVCGVIDFGPFVGDPACDLMFAWNLPAGDRDDLRAELEVDDATWLRGRGCAIYQWVGGLHEDEPDNEARRVIRRVLDDAAR
jgi:aminoglycoside phosphotransferase (APT) family kinase protein